jgi:zearalenone synthase (highly reducing iterative type I polyketide synthase)
LENFFWTQVLTGLTEEFSADKKDSKINQAIYSQPICTALQIALVDLLHHWGVRPVAVIGHSSGEIAAAYCKGAISRQSAWKIAYHRGRLTNLIKHLAPHIDGGMLVAGTNEEQALEYIKQVSAGKVSIACVNSPSNVTVSGDMLGINQLHEILTVDSIFTRKLKVETAYHSHHMDVIAAAYMESLHDLETLPESDSQALMFSSVTGDIVKSTDLGPKYWVDNMVSMVKFSAGTQLLLNFSSGMRDKKRRTRSDKAFVDILLEIGPHSTLEGPLREITQSDEAPKSTTLYLSLLSRGKNALETALEATGRLFVKGYPVDLQKVNSLRANNSGLPAPIADLPSYPWNHSSRYWCESHISAGHRFRKHPRYDLLGAPTADYNPMQPKWRNCIRKSENPWIQDHRVRRSSSSIWIYPKPQLDPVKHFIPRRRHDRNGR